MVKIKSHFGYVQLYHGDLTMERYKWWETSKQSAEKIWKHEFGIILEKYHHPPTGCSYARILTPRGRTGWIYEQYLDL